jgi:hypothetical protein
MTVAGHQPPVTQRIERAEGDQSPIILGDAK